MIKSFLLDKIEIFFGVVGVVKERGRSLIYFYKYYILAGFFFLWVIILENIYVWNFFLN